MENPDMTRLTELAVRAFAAGFAELRREAGFEPWDAAGVAAILREQAERRDGFQLVAALARAASDPKMRTPGCLRKPAVAGSVLPPLCGVHPSAGVRTDGTCGGCHADANEAPESSASFVRGPVPEQARRELRRDRDEASA